MSVIVAAMVWQTRRLMTSSEKFLLVALADQSNDDGLTVFLVGGTTELASRIEKSYTTCKRLLDSLETNGWIEVAAEKLQHRPRQYQLNVRKLREHQANGYNSSGVKTEKSSGVKTTLLDNPVGSFQNPVGSPDPSVGSNGACHIRNNVLHEDYMGRERETPPSPVSPSAVSDPETGPAYRKLADACRIQLPATDREGAWLRGALSELRKKMEQDTDSNPDAAAVKDWQIAEAVSNLLAFWKSEDWRGKNGEAPSPRQLVESYGKAKLWVR